MKGFGLAPIKRMGWCYEYDSGTTFNPLYDEFNIFYKEHGRKYIPKSTQYRIWKAALLSMAKKEV